MTRRDRRRAGYTLIEVMLGIAIMTFGAVGLMALQQATLKGNRQAREVTTATQATRTWLDRVQRDALKWNTRGLTGVVTTDYLSGVPAGPTPGAWTTPVSSTPPSAAGGDGEGFAFDYFGRDVLAADAYFCTNIRMRWAISDRAIRVDARTWWHRSGQGFTDRAAITCGPGSEATVTGDLDGAGPTLHAVYGSTLVRWSQR